MKKRIIKFRAWDKNKQKFAETFTLAEDNGEVVSFSNDAEMRKLELMQFTGLLDKNGKEIYEGDSIKYKIEGTEQAYLMTIRIPELFIELGHDDNYYLPQEESFEVIGNIYENPELLTPLIK